MSKADETRVRILDAALTLFNEQGVDKTTTNHVAATAGISPGNLYYHYKNKEEVVRTLVTSRLQPEIDEVWQFANEPAPTLEELRLALYRHFDIFWRFRFMRDNLVMMRVDPLFAQGFCAIYQTRMKQYQAMALRMQQNGILDAQLDLETLRNLVESGWVITSSWLSHLEATQTPATSASMQRGADLVLLIFRPYLRELTPVSEETGHGCPI